jgi:RHS repeat-associated protein
MSSPSYNAANQLTSHNGQTLTYDLNGNLTSDGTNTYTWNTRDQLVSISGSGLSASFIYDALGRRTSKSVNGATTGHLYNGDNIAQEQTGGSASANIVTGGLDQFFQRTDSAGTTSPLTDALGSVIALTDAAGAVQTSYTYEPFGSTSVTGASSSNPAQYTSRENDQTGLYYYRARYYSPSLQRFISEDPIGVSGGINLYAYVGNNPVSYSDPYGLSGWDFIAGLLESDSPFPPGPDLAGGLPVRGGAPVGMPPGINRESCDYKWGMYAREVIGAVASVAGAMAGLARGAARWARGAGRAGGGAGGGGGRSGFVGGGGRRGAGGAGGLPSGGKDPGEYLARKAPRQVPPGTRELEGVWVNDKGRVEPWKAYYDQYGRRIARNDYNAGNKKKGIPDTHHHKWEYGPGYSNGRKVPPDHFPGEYKP